MDPQSVCLIIYSDGVRELGSVLEEKVSSITTQKSPDLSAKKASGWSQICLSCLLLTAPCCPFKSLEAPSASLKKGKIATLIDDKGR